MATEAGTQRDQGEGPGRDGTPPAGRPGHRPWRLRGLLDELHENAGDLIAHLRAHWRLVLGLAAAALAGGLLFAWSGIYSVAATAGHYPFFRYFLTFALRQSVDTHTFGIAVPPTLDDPAMIRHGAGHYQGGCAPCHGAPGQARNPISRRMLPEPPDLARHAGDWTAPELFWIVRNGIKYTGMPAWAAPEREDEVWSVVAFLLRLPGMDAPAYRRLAFGEVGEATSGAEEGLRLLLLNGPAGNGAAACARCHGADGAGGGSGAFPRLQGQTAAYLHEALQAYALGTRPSGIMQPVAAALEQAEMRLLAAHYAGQPAPPAAAADADAETLALGRRIALEGLPRRGVAACAGCHGPKPGPAQPLYPRLSGQYAGYIATQLELFLAGVRGGERERPLARLMAHGVGVDPRHPPAREALWPLRRDEIRAVAAWYAAQPPAAEEPASAEAERR